MLIVSWHETQLGTFQHVGVTVSFKSVLFLSLLTHCFMFIHFVSDYLGRESQAKRETAMDFDGWQFFAVKVNLL